MPSNSNSLPLARYDFPFSSVRCRVLLTVFAPILSTFALIRAEIISDATTAKLSNTRSVFKDEGKRSSFISIFQWEKEISLKGRC